jgi:predicted permease
MLSDLLIRLRALFRRNTVESELDEELRFHFDREVEKWIHSGLPLAEARRRAQITFGGTEQIRTECREARGVNLVESLAQDFRYGIRTLTRNSGFTAVAVVTLALGIGTVTAMFSTLWTVALQPLPFPQPDRLVWIEATTNTGQRNSLSALDYFDYRDRTNVFESLAARSIWQPGKVILGNGEPERISGAKVSGNFFHTLGVQPLYGRSFLDAEQSAGGSNAVVLSYGYWQQRLGANPAVVGTNLTVDNMTYTVVGIMPSGFDYPTGVSLWFPMRSGGDEESGRGNNNFVIVGRLADGVSLQQAQAQMSTIATGIAKANPESKNGWGIALTSLHEQFFGNVRPLMLMLMAAAALLLLIACGNLSSLMLARVMSRRDELALRLSLGASSWRIGRQLLIESILLTATGACVGLFLAWLLIHAVKAAAPGNLPRIDSIHMDGPALLVAIAATTVATLLAGLMPALRGARMNSCGNLLHKGRSTEGQRHLTLRKFMVAGQISLSLLLLIAMGLLLRSADRLQRVDTGLQPDHLLTLNVQSPNAEAAPRIAAQNYDRMLERIRALPGVTGPLPQTSCPSLADRGTPSFARTVPRKLLRMWFLPRGASSPESSFRPWVSHYWLAADLIVPTRLAPSASP